MHRVNEYSTSQQILIFCGTYNLNGKSFKGEKLDPWLLQHTRCKLKHTSWKDIHLAILSTGNQANEPDIYAIGFQEIVELSPQQVMATDAEKR